MISEEIIKKILRYLTIYKLKFSGKVGRLVGEREGEGSSHESDSLITCSYSQYVYN